MTCERGDLFLFSFFFFSVSLVTPTLNSLSKMKYIYIYKNIYMYNMYKFGIILDTQRWNHRAIRFRVYRRESRFRHAIWRIYWYKVKMGTINYSCCISKIWKCCGEENERLQAVPLFRYLIREYFLGFIYYSYHILLFVLSNAIGSYNKNSEYNWSIDFNLSSFQRIIYLLFSLLDIIIFIATQRELKIPLIYKFEIVSISGISICSFRIVKYSSLCRIENRLILR